MQVTLEFVFKSNLRCIDQSKPIVFQDDQSKPSNSHPGVTQNLNRHVLLCVGDRSPFGSGFCVVDCVRLGVVWEWLCPATLEPFGNWLMVRLACEIGMFLVYFERGFGVEFWRGFGVVWEWLLRGGLEPFGNCLEVVVRARLEPFRHWLGVFLACEIGVFLAWFKSGFGVEDWRGFGVVWGWLLRGGLSNQILSCHRSDSRLCISRQPHVL